MSVAPLEAAFADAKATMGDGATPMLCDFALGHLQGDACLGIWSDPDAVRSPSGALGHLQGNLHPRVMVGPNLWSIP